MASNSARILLSRSMSSTKTVLSRVQSSHSVASGPWNLGGLSNTATRLVPRRRPILSRLPVELTCGESLMPLHSATASSLMNSMLSSKVGQWGFLSEGFATPL